MGKNIVIFSDGTGQKGGKNTNTNVYKLFNMIEERTDKQIAFYDPGLGTDWRKITGNIAGRGFSKNILDCYRFLFQHYEAGDDIYLFGFSRGAATVRSLSGFIHLFGILPQSREDLIQEAFKIYQIRNQMRRLRKAVEFIDRNHTMWCKIKFLGVFDTVAALGIPNKFFSFLFEPFSRSKFHSFELSKSVIYARHALSIDEERRLFSPVLWAPLVNDPLPDRMKQVWFSGVHTDVGGGYKEDHLSNISLQWMLREAIDKGLLIYERAPAYKSFKNAELNVNGIMHNERKGFIGKLFRKGTRTWKEESLGAPTIHTSVFKRTKNNSNLDEPGYAPWIFSYTNKNIEE